MVLAVGGLSVGHAARTGPGSLTGTTVVLAPPEGAVCGVDVRGGAPGTRETDLLDPRRTVERVHAVVLTGGSAYGLAAADGVVRGLEQEGRGLLVDPERGLRVPLVPAAVLFDLGRGGDAAQRPDAALGRAALREALAGGGAVRGPVGAGTGAVAGGLRGGLGSASQLTPGGAVLGALVALNCAGSVLDPATGRLHEPPPGLGTPDPAEAARWRAARAAAPGLSLNTTLVVVGTDAPLDKAGCAALAGVAHDGIGRTVRPAHTAVDGDVVFALSTGQGPAAPLAVRQELLAAVADVVAAAVTDAVLTATSVATPAGTWPSYREAFPSAFSAGSRGRPASP